jgi:hypothetical protein
MLWWIKNLLLMYFSGGHALLVRCADYELLMVNTLAQALELDFKKISVYSGFDAF